MAHEVATPVHAALRLLELGRAELAAEQLRQWLAGAPGDAHAHLVLGLCLAEQGRGAEALAAGDEGLRLAPDDAWAHHLSGCIHFRLRDWRRVIAAARAAIALDPSQPHYHGNLAAGLLNRRIPRPRQALAAAEAGLRANPADPDCARIRAQCLSRLRRHQEARDAADLALRLDPGRAESHAIRGWAELMARRPGAARPYMLEALRMDASNANAALGLGRAEAWARWAAGMLLVEQRWPIPAALMAVLIGTSSIVSAALFPEPDTCLALLGGILFLSFVGGPVAVLRRKDPGRLAERLTLAAALRRDRAQGIAGYFCFTTVALLYTAATLTRLLPNFTLFGIPWRR